MYFWVLWQAGDLKMEEIIEMCGGCRFMAQPPEPFLIEKLKRENRRVCLNVGGERHEVLWKTLERIPNSRLGLIRRCNDHMALLELCDDYSLVDNEFYFDRHPLSFSSILNFYRTGHLHLVREVSVLAFSEDLEYWGIDATLLEFCCQRRFNEKSEQVYDEIKKEGDAINQIEDEDFGDGRFAQIQKFGWDTMEKPQSGKTARGVASVSIFFIVISTVSLCVNTIPAVQMWECVNETDTVCQENLQSNPPQAKDISDEVVHQIDNIYLAKIESICIAWFTLEYLLRLVFCPSKRRFLQGALNFIDILAIMPYYLTTFFMDAKPTTGEEDGFRRAFRKFVQVFRLMRVLRIFKLGRHSRGLQSLGYTVTNSYKELGLLVMFLGLGVLIFSSLEYFAESEDNAENFESIPVTFWWALITMTTGT